MNLVPARTVLELFRLLKDCQRGDVLLIEDVERLSRLAGDGWNTLKKMIGRKDVRIVVVNVPEAWLHLSPTLADFDSRMSGAINDMLAAVACRDYEQRRERQKQGIGKAGAEGKYRGRRINQHRHDAINRLLASERKLPGQSSMSTTKPCWTTMNIV